MERPRLVIDCDPGHDDVLAIGLAAQHAELLGITTVAGNASLADTTRNALVACEVFSLDVPVHSGADRPLVEPARDAAHIHGRTGLAGPEPIEPARRPTGDDAVGFLVETLRAAPDAWLVATGPLTNVALALRSAPHLARSLRGISFMGGSAGLGNRTAAAEANAASDPEALAVVLDSGVPLRMSGLHLTLEVRATEADVAHLRARGTRAARFCADLLDAYRHAYGERTGRAEAPLHDPCAVACVLRPELFVFERRRVDVELTGTHTRGMTLVDRRLEAPSGNENVEVAITVDAPAVVTLVLGAIAGSSG